MHAKSRTPAKLFVTISCILAILDASLVALTFFQNRKTVIENFEKEAQNRFAIFEHDLKVTADNMLQIATFVANDPRIQDAFLQGKRAVDREGGGPGGEESAKARAGLFDIVSHSWSKMTQKYTVRQLHFHLAPGSLSFLRVHKPQKFGDRMDDVRFTIVDANATLKETSGFETGRVYSGIRGVQPVFATDPVTQKQVHVGAVEAGTSFNVLLGKLSKTYGSDIAVLLTLEHLKAKVWPEYLDKRLEKTPPLHGDLVLEETTSTEIRDLLDPEKTVVWHGFGKIKVLRQKDRFFIVSRHPLRDYRGSIHAEQKDAGEVVFWKDITAFRHEFLNDLKINIIYAVAGYILVELLLFFGIRRTTARLNAIIEQRTEQLAKETLLQQQTERNFRHSEQQKHLILESAGDGIYGVDTDGRIIFINPAACRMLGYQEYELIGEFAHEKVHHAFANGKPYPYEQCPMYTTLLNGKSAQVNDDVFWRKEGKYFAVKYSSTPIYENDEIVGAVISFDDISEQIKTEQDLREAKQQAETANQAKSEFLSRMSHELRTPLNAILGFGQLLELEDDPPLSESQQESVEHILEGGRHLLSLINEVLDLAKIDAGRVELKIEQVNLQSLIKETVALIETLAMQRNISISLKNISDAKVCADYIRLKQILLNLGSNAVKYNREGGTLTIECKLMADNRMGIFVADSGHGIPDDKRDAVFQPFDRLGSENSEIEGTGIGLTITKRLVEAMSGSIDFESTLGKGTTFWIEIPLATQQESESKEKTEIKTIVDCNLVNRAMKILYIEDNPANIALMNMVLQRCLDKAEILIAHNAELGLAIARKELPDIVLMDIHLPGMDGIAALEVLRKNTETSGIPVVAISASAMPRDMEKALEAGFSAYITKPFDVKELVQAIGKAVSA